MENKNIEQAGTFPENVESNKQHEKRQGFWKRLTSKQKVAAIAGVIIAAGAIGGGVWYTLNHTSDTAPAEMNSEGKYTESTTVTSSTVKLVSGENVIEKGGTYEIFGAITGRIKISTEDAVTLVVNSDVTINNEEESGAISSKGNLTIKGSGTLTIKSAGKGIKADELLTIESGTYVITAEDDTVHSNDSVAISGGTLTLASGDDGVHADGDLTISGGKIDITKSYEGLEGQNITISGGDISVVASDDGVNVAGGNDESGGGGQDGGMWRGGPMGQATDGTLTISGGTIYVNAGGDGLDSNGSVKISGGTTYVDGPTNNGDGALDYDGSMEITGGTLIAVGSSGMAMNASTATQPSVLMNLSSSYTGEFTFGNIKFKPAKAYQSVMISSPELKVGESYDLVIGGQTVTSVTAYPLAAPRPE